MTDSAIQYATRNPKSVFVIDGLGALLSAFLLAIVLAEFEHIFGIPRPVCYMLAVFPCLFAVYDLNCIVSNRMNTGTLIKPIAIMNILYCGISLAVAVYRHDALTLFGWLYSAAEIAVVATLAQFELKVAKKLSST